jgi:hypothetical protein
MQIEAAFQCQPDRLQALCRRLHHDFLYALLIQPLGQLRQRPANGAEQLPLENQSAFRYFADRLRTDRRRVGDLFMSLIHNCELNQVNPFDYLTELLRHPPEVAVRPAEWCPARTHRPLR